MKMEDWLLPLPVLTVDDQFRFWGKVDRRNSEECWNWTASLYDHRYGRFRVSKLSYSAHRISYLIHAGKDPGKLLVLHTCNNTRCVNPSHLYLGDNSDNQLDRVAARNHVQSGDLNPNAKLRDEEVKEILVLLKTVGRAELAKRFRVSITTIHKIARGEIWRHLWDSST